MTTKNARMLSDEDDERRSPAALTESVRNRLFKHRSIIISGDINQALAGEVMAQLLALSADGDAPINVFINSQGGHVESGDTIHDFIRFVKPRVRVIGTGWVASAGALIYVAVPREDRYCLPNTRFLLHQPSGGMRGSTRDVEIEAEQILKMHDRLYRILARQTGKSVEQIDKDTKRNFWLDAAAAREYGLVGQVIESIDELR